MKIYMSLIDYEAGTKIDVYRAGEDLYTVKCYEYNESCDTWKCFCVEEGCTAQYIYDVYQLGV